MRASAPMRMPPLTDSIDASGNALMSTRCAGRSTSHFIRSTRFVPPATNFVCAFAPAVSACDASVTREYSNGCIRPSVLRRFLHRLDDSAVCAATADVAAHPFADFVIAAGMSLLQQRDGRADVSRRAVAALESVIADERGLHRMQRSVRRETFNRGDPLARVHDRQRQAGVVTAAINQHRARAARTLIATFFRAGEIEMLAQCVEQRRARI